MSTQARDATPTPETVEFVNALAHGALAEIRAACRVALSAMSSTPKPIEHDDLRMLLQMVVTRAELTMMHIDDASTAQNGEFSRHRGGGNISIT